MIYTISTYRVYLKTQKIPPNRNVYKNYPKNFHGKIVKFQKFIFFRQITMFHKKTKEFSREKLSNPKS